MPGRDGEVDVGLAGRSRVSRGSIATISGGFGPASRSRIRAQSTVCCEAMLWPTRKMASRGRCRRRSRAGRRRRRSPSGGCGGRRAEPGVAVHVRRADAGLADARRACSTPRGRAGRSCRSRGSAGPNRRGARGSARRPGSSPRPSSPAAARRRGGRAAWSAGRGCAFASQPWRPFGPEPPAVDAVVAATPRTPTISPSLTPMSQAAAVGAEHAGRGHPAVDLVGGDALGERDVDPFRPVLACSESGARTPDIVDTGLLHGVTVFRKPVTFKPLRPRALRAAANATAGVDGTGGT